jgi:hypothetical protein
MKRIRFTALACILLGTAACAQDYFPNLAFSDNQKLHNSTVQWYSKHLRAMEEPSLFEAAPQGAEETFRFVWLRTWHNPLSVRIMIRGNGRAEMLVKMSDGAGGYKPGVLAKNATVSLDAEETKTLLGLIAKAGFWELSTTEDRRGFDGAEWIFEGRKADRYHVTTRWTPGKGAYRELGVFIILRSKLGIKPEDIY